MLMRVLSVSFGVLLAASAGIAVAADQPAKPSSCARVRSIDSWKAIDERHAYVYTSWRQKYKVTFFTECLEMKRAFSVRVESFGMCLARGDTLIFSVPFDRSAITEECIITEIVAMPLEERGAAKAADATPR